MLKCPVSPNETFEGVPWYSQYKHGTAPHSTDTAHTVCSLIKAKYKIPHSLLHPLTGWLFTRDVCPCVEWRSVRQWPVAWCQQIIMNGPASPGGPGCQCDPPLTDWHSWYSSSSSTWSPCPASLSSIDQGMTHCPGPCVRVVGCVGGARRWSHLELQSVISGH